MAGLKGIAVFARDERLGSLIDLKIDDATWEARFLEIDVDQPGPLRRVLVSPHWIDNVSVSEHLLVIEPSLADVAGAPPYDPAVPVTEDYEFSLFQHYGRSEDFDAVLMKAKVT
jgi:hypothetical protein